MSIVLRLVFIAVVVGNIGNAIQLIELNDANKNVLLMSLSKSVEGVQDGLVDDFEFESVEGMKKFLAKCEYVNIIMSKTPEDGFNGLAKKIKALMADKTVSSACSVKEEDLKGFEELDYGFNPAEHDYMSEKSFQRLKKMRDAAEANEGLRLVTEHLITKRIAGLSDALLEQASLTIDYALDEEVEKKGWFDFDVEYKRLCEVSLIEPICKLVRRSNKKATVIGADFEDFIQMVKSNNKEKLEQNEKASGVSMEQLKSSCKVILEKNVKVFKPIYLIREYVSARFIGDKQLADHLQQDSDLASYMGLYDLCTLVK